MALSAAVSGADPARHPLGDELEAFLDHLGNSGLKIGPRERVAVAALTASLVTAGGAVTLGALAPMLAPLLACSPEERQTFARVLGAFAPTRESAPEPPAPPSDAVSGSETSASPSWWLPLALLGLLAAAVAAAILYWPEPTKPVVEIEKPPPAPVASSRRAEQTVEAPRPTSFESLGRIEKAAERFEGAPTLGELSRELAKGSRIAWPAESYAVRLRELTGLPAAMPIGLYLGKGEAWARLALALERIEQPGREAEPEALLAAAARAVEGRTPGTVYEVEALLRAEAATLEAKCAEEWGRPREATQFPRVEDFVRRCSGSPTGETVRQSFAIDPPSRDSALSQRLIVEKIQQQVHGRRTGRDEEPLAVDAVDEQTVLRALAIARDARARRLADAPWLPERDASGGSARWWWAWAAMLVPLALAFVWLANSLALRKAYLRRRPPELPPLHVDLVAQAASRIAYPATLYRRIAQRLQRRTQRATGQIDPTATVHATIRAGGEMIVPVEGEVRRAPEYLVLIERTSVADQDAARLRELVRRLEALVPLVVYYFDDETSMVEPEGGGRSEPIERLQAQLADHRLLVLGAGAGLLDPATLKPLPSALKLMHWRERALLSPLAIAEWGREELSLAAGLEMPVGRATPEGLLVLAEVMGRDHDEVPGFLIDVSADARARPLPHGLRIRPQRFLYGEPPADLPVPQLMQQLRNFLDGPGFDWLAALAIYPAVQWDLTLYLGVTLAERTGGDEKRLAPPLYREDRLAALTQLPWLREGFMPDWLRRALIAEVGAERAAEIRRALQRLVAAAEIADGRRLDEAVRLRIARDGTSPGEVLEDEVFVDFLARGRIEDFALPRLGLLERLLPRGLLDRIGVPELAAGAIAASYAAAAWWLAPRTADAGELAAGAWLPLAVLAAGGLLVFAISELRETYRFTRRALGGLGAWGLALSGLAGTCGLLGLQATDVGLAGFPLDLTILIAGLIAVLVGSGAVMATAEHFARGRLNLDPLGTSGFVGRSFAWMAAFLLLITALAFATDAVTPNDLTGALTPITDALGELQKSNVLVALAVVAAGVLLLLAVVLARRVDRLGLSGGPVDAHVARWPVRLMTRAWLYAVGLLCWAALVVVLVTLVLVAVAPQPGNLLPGGHVSAWLVLGAIIAALALLLGLARRIVRVPLRLRPASGSRAWRWGARGASAALLGVTWVLAQSTMGTGVGSAPAAWLVVATGAGLLTIAVLATRLLPERLAPPRPAPREQRRLWSLGSGALRSALSLLPILPALWIAQAVGTQSQLLASMPGGPAALAEAKDGSHLALADDDGRILVWARRAGRLSGTPVTINAKTPTGPVTSLALRFDHDEPARALLLGVASADGAVRLYDGRTGAERELAPSLQAARSTSAAPRVAIDGAGDMLAAVEGRDGASLLVSSGGSTAIDIGGPVTAVAGADHGFLVATLDGQVRIATVSPGASPKLIENETDAPRLPGRARSVDVDAEGRVAAFGDDGSVLTGKVEGARLTGLKLTEARIEAIALGATVPWQSRFAPTVARSASQQSERVRPLAQARPAPEAGARVVPIFFGTNRRRAEGTTKPSYGAERSGRLETGRALISVPLNHQVSSIERPTGIDLPGLGNLQLQSEDPNRHFIVREVAPLPADELTRLAGEALGGSTRSKGQSLLFIHGYNVSFENALFRAAQISFDMGFDGAMFLFSWPSAGGLNGYIYDLDSARGSDSYLRQFLQMMVNMAGPNRVSVLAHATGAQPLLQALSGLARGREPGSPMLDQVIFAAPDVDTDAFAVAVSEGIRAARGVTLYVSANDRALEVSRMIFSGQPRAGSVPPSGPLIVPGVDTIDVSQATDGLFSIGHSAYAESSVLLSDVRQLLATGLRPPDRRNPALQAIKTPQGMFWRYTR